MNHTSFLPQVKLPSIYVHDIRENTFWENASYIPILSNVKGAIEVLIGTAMTVSSVAIATIPLVLLPLAILRDLAVGSPIFGASRPSDLLPPFSTICADSLHSLAGMEVTGITLLTRGIIESIPVAGNLVLGFWDEKIIVRL